MENRKVFLVVGAALFVGLMTGILLPAFFGSGEPPRPAPPPNREAQGVQSGPDYSLKISELKRQLQKNPLDFGLLVQLGNTYFDSNLYDESIETYQKALAVRPGSPDVLTDLGIMFRRSGQPEKAVECFRKAAALSPSHLQSRMNLGIVLFFDLGDPEGALEALEDFVRISGDSPGADNARALIAQIQRSTGK